MDKTNYKKESPKVIAYIKNNWAKTVRIGGKPKGLDIPYPYTTPCAEERYTCFFYWDTYFTNLGLLIDDIQQAKNNIEALKFFVEQMGYIPNGNEQVMFNHSQPPLYAHAVRDYYEKTKDVGFVLEHYAWIKKEYEFWMRERQTPIGLNQYNARPSEQELSVFYKEELAGRGVGYDGMPNCEVLHYFAESESGWDFSNRYEGKALDFVQVDLNSILYENERILRDFAKLLNNEDDEKYFTLALNKRKALMEKYLADENGVYHDYDYVNGVRSEKVTVACLLPYVFGVSDDKKACKATLAKLEFEYGVSAGEKTDGKVFQWGYPNCWPPLVFWTYKALVKAGLEEDAARIKTKYINVVDVNFEKSGKLWEKYNVATGEVSNTEYESPSMMGWTAGVYRYLKEV